jgi:putative zinc finger protein
MKKADNNEVDLLLRAFASGRQKGRLPSADSQRVLSEHLDADELNAFVEGQLPRLARARYTEHLADCESCRSILITLAPAAGVPVSAPVSGSQGASSVWSKISVFFSPPVLRYAVPALALAAVIGISLFALRQQRTTDFVAQHQPENPSTSEAVDVQNAAPPTQPNATPPTLQNGNLSSKEAEVSKEKSNLTGREQVAENTAGTDVTTATIVKDSPKAGQADMAQAAPSFAPEPQSPAPPPPRPALSEADKSVTLNRQETSERERGRDYRSDPRDEAGNNRSASKTSTAPANARRVEGLMAERSGVGSVRNKKDGPAETEMRGVAGRQFRRQGNAWVDTAYNSSRATINVARGSEQFRALIADEPGLRDIANQLGGEVIVVWKSRAYRIR